MQSHYIPIIIILIMLLILWRRRRAVIAAKIMKKRKVEDKTKMIELAKRFIDMECIISAFDSTHQYIGMIKEVSNGALLIDRNGELQAINLDYIICIREYPRNKKARKRRL